MSRRLRSLILNIIFIVICVGLAYGLSNYMFSSIPVLGISMETTLHNGDNVLVYKPGNYQFGDIVVFNSHQQTASGERYLVKRIIGVEGDTIEVLKDDTDGKYYVYRNGEKLIEDYTNVDAPMTEEMARVTVGKGEFIYMGDNRGPSLDSRRTGEFGKIDDIVGRVVLRYVIEKGKDWDIQIVKRLK